MRHKFKHTFAGSLLCVELRPQVWARHTATGEHLLYASPSLPALISAWDAALMSPIVQVGKLRQETRNGPSQDHTTKGLWVSR